MENPWGISTGIRPVKIARCRIADGCDDENIVRYYDDKYKICEDRARLCINIARLELDILKTVNDNDICVYIGIPFCKTRCLYCSFVTNSAENNAYLKTGLYCRTGKRNQVYRGYYKKTRTSYNLSVYRRRNPNGAFLR